MMKKSKISKVVFFLNQYCILFNKESENALQKSNRSVFKMIIIFTDFYLNSNQIQLLKYKRIQIILGYNF